MQEISFRDNILPLKDKLFRLALRITFDRAEAEDIVQDVFVELWNNKSKIDFDDHIKSFLYKSVYTRSINFLKHKSVVDSYTSEEKEFFAQKIAYYNYENSEVMARLENMELKKEILSAINDLPDQSRKVFKMCYLYEM